MTTAQYVYHHLQHSVNKNLLDIVANGDTGQIAMSKHPLEAYLLRNDEPKAAFARRAGISRFAVYRIIQGKSVSLAMLRKVVAATGLSMADLIPEK